MHTEANTCWRSEGLVQAHTRLRAEREKQDKTNGSEVSRTIEQRQIAVLCVTLHTLLFLGEKGNPCIVIASRFIPSKMPGQCIHMLIEIMYSTIHILYYRRTTVVYSFPSSTSSTHGCSLKQHVPS